MPEWSSGSNGETPKASFVRDIYVDGENLLVYKPEADEVTDHMVGTPSSYIPDEAVAAARANALEAYQTWNGTFSIRSCVIEFSLMISMVGRL